MHGRVAMQLNGARKADDPEKKNAKRVLYDAARDGMQLHLRTQAADLDEHHKRVYTYFYTLSHTQFVTH